MTTEIAALGATGLFEYNGIRLTSGADFSFHIDMAVHYDDAGRTQEYVSCTFSVTKYIHADYVEAVNNRLTANCGVLKLTGLGWQDLEVNAPGGNVKDINYGPKPSRLVWRPLPGRMWWRLEFTITTDIPYCVNGEPVFDQELQSLTYELGFTLDEEGMTTRTVTGQLTIPARKANGVTGRKPTDVSDDYRDKIAPKTPIAFQRTTRDFRLSKDRKQLMFTIVDQEVNSDNPYPEGIVKIDATEAIENEDITFFRWSYTLNGTITVARPFPKVWAWEKFLLLVKDRADWQQAKAGARTIKIDQNTERKGGIMMMTRLRFEDEIFGRRSSFAVTWVLITDLKGIIVDSGIFKPIDELDWRKWADSLEPIWGNRGVAGLYYSTSNDAIVDLCEPGQRSSRSMGGDRNQRAQAPGESRSRKPDPDVSWIDYRCWVEYDEDQPMSVHKPLPPPGGFTITSTTSGRDEIDQKYDGQERPSAGVMYDKKRRDVIQIRGNPSSRATLIGYATRIAYEIVPPKLVKIEGVPVKPVQDGKQFRQVVIGESEGWPIYAATWRIQYTVDRVPDKTPKPKPRT